MTGNEITAPEPPSTDSHHRSASTLSHSAIKIRSLEVTQPPFRKLRNINIQISERLTVIGGHNGIGKSTILGIIANGSGIRSASHKSYFDLPFQAVFHELFTLSEDHDYKQKASERGSVNLKYELLDESGESVGVITKKCNVTKHNEKGATRLKIVPRTSNKQFGRAAGVGNDARIPLPTIYLGMSRVNPIGEVDQETVKRRTVRTFDSDDAEYYRSCLTNVIHIDLDDSDSIMLSHSFQGSKKRSKLPKLQFDSLAISSGQDSLSSILTALASFKRIQRQQGDDYMGGVLVIDEIEAGLHPHAQIKLIRLLKQEARNLKLQVIATSHSLVVMKEILDIDEAQKERGKILDSVVYISDSTDPVVMENPSYQKIKTNIFLERPNLTVQKEPIVKVYFEDEEGKYFFEKILEAFDLEAERDFGVKFDGIPSGIGCKTLLSLAAADDYFKSVLIVFDEDVMSEQTSREKIQNTPNYVALPSDDTVNENTPPSARTPEMVLYRYLQHLNRTRPPAFWMKTSGLGFDGNQIEEHILNLEQHKASGGKDRDKKDRDRNKQWFRENKDYFDKVDLMDFWVRDNSSAVEMFIDKVRLAVRHLLNEQK